MITPYTAVIQADEGASLPLGRWSMVTVEAQVTADTVGGTDVELVRAALGGRARVNVTLRCDGRRFVAESITRAD